MKFHVGLPPEKPSTLSSPTKMVFDYKKLHAYAAVASLLVALPLMYGVWRLMFSADVIFGLRNSGPLVFLGTVFGVCVLHEFLHLITHPHHGTSSSSLVGFDPKSGLPYAAYTAPTARWRLLTILLMPFLVLSLLAIPAALLWPQWAHVFAGSSIFNTMLAVGDLYFTYFILTKTPTGVYFENSFYGAPPNKNDK